MATAPDLTGKLRASIQLVNARKNQQNKQAKPPKIHQRKFTIEDAFSFDPSDYVGGIVRGNLAVAFLLDSLTDAGNKPLDGMAALGLSVALRGYAYRADRYLKGIHDDEDAEFFARARRPVIVNLDLPEPEAS